MDVEIRAFDRVHGDAIGFRIGIDIGRALIEEAGLALRVRRGVRILGAAADLVQRVAESGVGFGEKDTVLRAFRAGKRWHDAAEVKLQTGRVDRVFLFRAPVALCLGIGLDQLDALRVTAGVGEVLDRFLIDREEAASGAIFRRHVGDRRFVLERQVRKALTIEFDELADHAMLAQHLGDGQHEVGRGCAFCELAGQLEADDFRDQHGDRLAEHGRFGLDAANAPAEDRQAVDHRGVGVGADAGVEIGDGLAVFFLGPDRLAKIFEIHLVTDTGARRDNAEIAEGLGAPAQELITLLVALILDLHILLEAFRSAEEVDHDGVVDDEVDWDQRIDGFCIGAELFGGIAHGGKVNNGRHTGEVLHQDAGRAVGDLVADVALLVEPFLEGQNVGLGDRLAVFIAQHVFQQHLERGGQA